MPAADFAAEYSVDLSRSRRRWLRYRWVYTKTVCAAVALLIGRICAGHTEPLVLTALFMRIFLLLLGRLRCLLEPAPAQEAAAERQWQWQCALTAWVLAKPTKRVCCPDTFTGCSPNAAVSRSWWRPAVKLVNKAEHSKVIRRGCHDEVRSIASDVWVPAQLPHRHNDHCLIRRIKKMLKSGEVDQGKLTTAKRIHHSNEPLSAFVKQCELGTITVPEKDIVESAIEVLTQPFDNRPWHAIDSATTYKHIGLWSDWSGLQTLPQYDDFVQSHNGTVALMRDATAVTAPLSDFALASLHACMALCLPPARRLRPRQGVRDAERWFWRATSILCAADALGATLPVPQLAGKPVPLAHIRSPGPEAGHV